MAELRRHLTARFFHFRALARKLPLVALGLCAMCAIVRGADGSAGPVFTVLATGSQALPVDLHFLKSPDEGVPVAASVARRGEPLPAAAGATLVFGVPRAKPAKGESKFVPLCSVPWPAGAAERALVLMSFDGERLSGVAIDDGERVFPFGTLRVVNLIGRPIAARWGDATWEIAPGPGVARPYPAQPGGRFKVMLGTLRADGNGSTLIYTGRAEARPGARTLVVVREVRERALNDDNEIVDAGVSYTTRWVVDAPPPPPKSGL